MLTETESNAAWLPRASPVHHLANAHAAWRREKPSPASCPLHSHPPAFSLSICLSGRTGGAPLLPWPAAAESLRRRSSSSTTGALCLLHAPSSPCCASQPPLRSSRSQSPLAGHGKQPRARRRRAARRPGAAAALAAAVRGCASPPRRSRDSSPLPPAVSVTMAATIGAVVRRRLLCSWSGHHGQAAAERSSPTRVRGSPVLPLYSSPSIAASPAGFREPRRPPCSKSRQGPPTKIRRKSGF